jgi:hypothetical protein
MVISIHPGLLFQHSRVHSFTLPEVQLLHFFVQKVPSQTWRVRPRVPYRHTPIATKNLLRCRAGWQPAADCGHPLGTACVVFEMCVRHAVPAIFRMLTHAVRGRRASPTLTHGAVDVPIGCYLAPCVSVGLRVGNDIAGKLERVTACAHYILTACETPGFSCLPRPHSEGTFRRLATRLLSARRSRPSRWIPPETHT